MANAAQGLQWFRHGQIRPGPGSLCWLVDPPSGGRALRLSGSGVENKTEQTQALQHETRSKARLERPLLLVLQRLHLPVLAASGALQLWHSGLYKVRAPPGWHISERSLHTGLNFVLLNECSGLEEKPMYDTCYMCVANHPCGRLVGRKPGQSAILSLGVSFSVSVESRTCCAVASGLSGPSFKWVRGTREGVVWDVWAATTCCHLMANQGPQKRLLCPWGLGPKHPKRYHRPTGGNTETAKATRWEILQTRLLTS